MHPLIWVNRGESRLLRSWTEEEIRDASSGEGVFYFSHRWSIKLETFKNYPAWG